MTEVYDNFESGHLADAIAIHSNDGKSKPGRPQKPVIRICECF